MTEIRTELHTSTCIHALVGYEFGIKPATHSGFSQIDKLAIMAILPSEALLREKKPVAKCYPPPGGNRTQAASDSKSNIILSTLTWHLLIRLRL